MKLNIQLTEKEIGRWSMNLATLHAATYLILFLLISYLSTLIVLPENPSSLDKFEKYLILCIALFMIAPFGLSALLIFGLLKKSVQMIHVWIINAMVYTTILACLSLITGIYLAAKKRPDTGYALITSTVVFLAFMAPSIVLIRSYKIFHLQGKDVKRKGPKRLNI